ncbi:MAG: oligosaccharide flippase family protein [Duncaniella sp.]|nr:oligosaccharide flippase family protein [Duncaniella sp.]
MARLTRSALTRNVLKAMGTFGGLQIVQILCGAVRVKLVAIWLGAAGVGLFSIFNNAITMLTTVSQLGMGQTAVRDMAAATSGHDSRRVGLVAAVIRRWGLILGMAGFALTVFLSPFLARFTFGNYSSTWAFALLGIVVMMQIITASRQAVMRGIGRLNALARAIFIGVGGGLAISIPMFYYWRMGSILPSIIAYAAFALIATGWYSRRSCSGLPRVSPGIGETWNIGRDFLRLGLFMTVADASTQLLNYAFVAWLNGAASTAEVGIYQSGYTIVSRYVGMVFTAIGVEYYPRLATVANRNDRLRVFVSHEIRLLMLILLPVLPICIPMMPFVVRLLYSHAFLPAIPMIWLALPGMVLRGLSWSMAFVILAKGDGRTYLITEILSSAVGLLLNILGYRWMGLAGLGISFTVWYAIYSLLIAAVYHYRYRLTIARPVILLSLITFLIITIASVVAYICFA